MYKPWNSSRLNLEGENKHQNKLEENQELSHKSMFYT